MTDHELKNDIIRNTFIQVGRKYNQSDNIEGEVTELMKEAGFMEAMHICMENWAGVISKRIDEEQHEDIGE